MREETRRRLDRLLLMQRLKWIGTGVGIVALLVGLFLLTNLDSMVEDHRVAGRVERISVPVSKSAQQAVAVDVVLDDGRHTQVLALKEHEPHVGDHIDITEHRHATGRVTFTYR